jgi:hypothetical protein
LAGRLAAVLSEGQVQPPARNTSELRRTGGGEPLPEVDKIELTSPSKGKEFAVIPVADLQKLMEDAEMLADVKAYDTAKARLEDGEEELIPLEITERRLRGEPALRIWREYRNLPEPYPRAACEEVKGIARADRGD